MGINFVIRTDLDELDTCLVNLRNKNFTEVVLLCVDETICFTTNAKKHKDNLELCKKSIHGEDIEIEMYREHLCWIDRGNLNILPFNSILRWVIE